MQLHYKSIKKDRNKIYKLSFTLAKTEKQLNYLFTLHHWRILVTRLCNVNSLIYEKANCLYRTKVYIAIVAHNEMRV